MSASARQCHDVCDTMGAVLVYADFVVRVINSLSASYQRSVMPATSLLKCTRSARGSVRSE